MFSADLPASVNISSSRYLRAIAWERRNLRLMSFKISERPGFKVGTLCLTSSAASFYSFVIWSPKELSLKITDEFSPSAAMKFWGFFFFLSSSSEKWGLSTFTADMKDKSKACSSLKFDLAPISSNFPISRRSSNFESVWRVSFTWWIAILLISFVGYILGITLNSLTFFVFYTRVSVFAKVEAAGRGAISTGFAASSASLLSYSKNFTTSARWSPLSSDSSSWMSSELSSSLFCKSYSSC